MLERRPESCRISLVECTNFSCRRRYKVAVDPQLSLCRPDSLATVNKAHTTTLLSTSATRTTRRAMNGKLLGILGIEALRG